MSFDIKTDSEILSQLFPIIRGLKKLEKLKMEVIWCSNILSIINRHLNKECCIKDLEINFLVPNSDSNSLEIKFPKYMKNLQSLTLLNVQDYDLTDTMFDMAS